MTIQEILDNILHAVFGRDVRQSMHDGIEQCYKDATGHPDSVAAVIKENKEMQEHLNNTPYMFLEEEEEKDLPVHTINDDEIGAASTWSSEKINGKIQEVFQNASNGKSKLATAIGNGATADMTWDQLANLLLQSKIYVNGIDFTSSSRWNSTYEYWWDTADLIGINIDPYVVIMKVTDQSYGDYTYEWNLYMSQQELTDGPIHVHLDKFVTTGKNCVNIKFDDANNRSMDKVTVNEIVVIGTSSEGRKS